MPEHLNFPDLVNIGAPFSNLVLDDDYAFLSGLVAADTEEGLSILGDVRAETDVVDAHRPRCWRRSGLGWRTSCAAMCT